MAQSSAQDYPKGGREAMAELRRRQARLEMAQRTTRRRETRFQASELDGPMKLSVLVGRQGEASVYVITRQRTGDSCQKMVHDCAFFEESLATEKCDILTGQQQDYVFSVAEVVISKLSEQGLSLLITNEASLPYHCRTITIEAIFSALKLRSGGGRTRTLSC